MTDDRTETIHDRAAIRDSDEPSERGDFPCCTPERVPLDLDALHETICDKFTGMDEVRQAADLLVAEVRRLAAVDDDLSRQIHETGGLLERAQAAEAAEAEVGTLRAKLAAVEALVSDGQTVGWIERDGDVAWISADAIRAALATGEGK